MDRSGVSLPRGRLDAWATTTSVAMSMSTPQQGRRVPGGYLAHLPRRYQHRYPWLGEFLRFCAVGSLGVFIDLATVVILKELWAFDTRLCAAGGFAIAMTANYIFNRNWTFPLARHTPWIRSYLAYAGTNLLGLGVRVITIQLLILLIGLDVGYGYLITNLIGIGAATLVNFTGAKGFAFDPSRLAFATEVAAPGDPRRTTEVNSSFAVKARLDATEVAVTTDARPPIVEERTHFPERQ